MGSLALGQKTRWQMFDYLATSTGHYHRKRRVLRQIYACSSFLMNAPGSAQLDAAPAHASPDTGGR